MNTDELTLLLRHRDPTAPRPLAGCPGDGEIAAFVDGTLEAARAGELRRHLAACDPCLDRVGLAARLEDSPAPEIGGELLDRVRDLPRPEAARGSRRRWRWAAVAAAVLLALVVVGPLGLSDRGERAQPDAVRDLPGPAEGPEILWPPEGAVIPAGRLDGLTLRWTEVPAAVFYELRLVSADGDLLWQGRSETASLTLPGGLGVAAGQRLFCWVRAYLPDGKSLQSAMVGFELEGGAGRE